VSGGADVGEDAAQIVERVGLGFGAVAGDEFEAGVAENDDLAAIVGENDEDGQDGVLEQGGMEERCLGGRVIRVDAESELLLRVRVAAGHGGGRDELGHGEVAGKGGEDERGEDGGERANSLHAGL